MCRVSPPAGALTFVWWSCSTKQRFVCVLSCALGVAGVRALLSLVRKAKTHTVAMCVSLHARAAALHRQRLWQLDTQPGMLHARVQMRAVCDVVSPRLRGAQEPAAAERSHLLLAAAYSWRLRCAETSGVRDFRAGGHEAVRVTHAERCLARACTASLRRAAEDDLAATTEASSAACRIPLLWPPMAAATAAEALPGPGNSPAQAQQRRAAASTWLLICARHVLQSCQTSRLAKRLAKQAQRGKAVLVHAAPLYLHPADAEADWEADSHVDPEDGHLQDQEPARE